MPVARVLLSAISQYGIELLGPRDGINRRFTTPDIFEETTIRVYRNGVRQHVGATSDYLLYESSGPGTGFDTVEFTAFPPQSYEALFVDYLIS